MAFAVPLGGPNWFNGIDSAFEIVSIIIALTVWWYARKIKCLTGDATCSSLSNAFLLIALSLVIKVVTNVIAYLELKDLCRVCQLNEVLGVQVMFASGYFLYRLFFLIALIWLVCVGFKVYDPRIRLLFVIFAAIGTLFSHYSYVVFHLIAGVLLMYIVGASYGTYRQTGNKRSAIVAGSFLLLLLSQVMCLFVGFDSSMYVAGESFQLAGFLGILYNQFSLRSVEPCPCGRELLARSCKKSEVKRKRR